MSATSARITRRLDHDAGLRMQEGLRRLRPDDPRGLRARRHPHRRQRRRPGGRPHVAPLHGERVPARRPHRVPRRSPARMVVRLAAECVTVSRRARASTTRGPKDPSGETWFRPSLQHELLHAFDLHHTAARCSMMNHRGAGGFPSAYRPDHEAIRRAARRARPAARRLSGHRNPLGRRGSRRLVRRDAGLRRAARPISSSSAPRASARAGVTRRRAARAASTARRTDRPRSATPARPCGPDSASRTTPRKRWTSTAELWLSKDETWDPSDVPVDADVSRHLDAATSTLVAAKWTLPTLCTGEYHPIVHLVAMHTRPTGQPTQPR